jgi:hypothetical protein
MIPPGARCGAIGFTRSDQPSSSSSRSAVRELHYRQAATQFSQL